MRIGLFGGSFDPVHLGHLLVAQAALEEASLDRVVFIPAAQSPFKPQSAPAPGADRLRLLRLALAGQTQMVVDDLELRRGGVSYTIETVSEYRNRFPAAEFFYLIGADHVTQLPQWRAASELAERVTFVVIPRPGGLVTPLPRTFRGIVLGGFPLGVSSSQIRARIKAQQSIEWLVPATVAEAIRNYRLYLPPPLC